MELELFHLNVVSLTDFLKYESPEYNIEHPWYMLDILAQIAKDKFPENEDCVKHILHMYFVGARIKNIDILKNHILDIITPNFVFSTYLEEYEFPEGYMNLYDILEYYRSRNMFITLNDSYSVEIYNKMKFYYEPLMDEYPNLTIKK